jgi:DNA repair protein RadC
MLDLTVAGAESLEASTSAPSPSLGPDLADSPRERLLVLGAGALATSELIAVLLGTGMAGVPVLALARDLAADGLTSLARLSPHLLAQRRGIGLAKALRLIAAFELGRRLSAGSTPETRPRLDSPDNVAAYLFPRHADHPHEVFGVLALDSRHRLLGERVVATGGRHSVSVTPADVFQSVLPLRPRCVVAFHNHPGGDPDPSEEDKALTHRLVRSGEVLGIPLVDHVILGGRRFSSFRQLGLI